MTFLTRTLAPKILYLRGTRCRHRGTRCAPLAPRYALCTEVRVVGARTHNQVVTPFNCAEMDLSSVGFGGRREQRGGVLATRMIPRALLIKSFLVPWTVTERKPHHTPCAREWGSAYQAAACEDHTAAQGYPATCSERASGCLPTSVSRPARHQTPRSPPHTIGGPSCTPRDRRRGRCRSGACHRGTRSGTAARHGRNSRTDRFVTKHMKMSILCRADNPPRNRKHRSIPVLD